MPRLADVHVSHTSDTGETIACVCKAYVSNDGRFSYSIPGVIKGDAWDLAKGLREDPDERATIGDAFVDYVGGELRVVSSEARKGEYFLKALVERWLKCETTAEDVLIYRYSSGVHYWKTSSGQIFPNGGWSMHDGRWYGGETPYTNESRSEYSVGFAAFAGVKKIHRRGTVEKIEFERWRSKKQWDHDDPDPRAKLNAFNHLGFPEHLNARWTIIPYTPEAAEFFYTVMIGLCKIDDRMNTFFGDKAKVQQAIDSGTKFLL